MAIKVKLRSTAKSSIVSPQYKPDLIITTRDIKDLNVNNVENGYSLIYNSQTQKFEASPVTLTGAIIDKVYDGTF